MSYTRKFQVTGVGEREYEIIHEQEKAFSDKGKVIRISQVFINGVIGKANRDNTFFIKEKFDRFDYLENCEYLDWEEIGSNGWFRPIGGE